MQAKQQLYYFVDIQEHNYDLKVLASTYFPHSNINVRNIHQSYGVKKRQVEMLKQYGGNNYIEPPVESSFLCFKNKLNPRDKFLKTFLDALPQEHPVIRDGKLEIIPTRDIVYGDIIMLEEGNICPADCRFLWIDKEKELLVDITSIKGKQFPPVHASLFATDSLPLKTQNLIFSGCKVLQGKAIALVIAVGSRCVQVRLIDYLLKEAAMAEGKTIPEEPNENTAVPLSTRARSHSMQYTAGGRSSTDSKSSKGDSLTEKKPRQINRAASLFKAKQSSPVKTYNRKYSLTKSSPSSSPPTFV
ncbi:predicted protein [Naegleria gruberi]|uniref:Predicted protein n=1 Tax=Naegleria gruberi TaxID=5762 RepID=D2VK07_NAEGR|nr:uncharacterized protein NAEGRDRAFT_69227 [Naegleria gruberi]EFC42779.1 predicted protein [Naegleria gruberi]|eukprot:XP_002675523.1 predicted protein [Naegleria gruberi strain NEG-M]